MRSVQEIGLAEAVSHIHNTCRRHQRPFFFMAGAGISHPPVPLASEITSECKKLCHCAESRDSADPMKDYSWWFQQAFHSPADRQWYLRRLIDGKFVSHANLRLAHVLLSKTISNLVVTTNFDDFLSRALVIFGEPHIVCDHPDTIQRIDPDKDELQIVHVHGTYWFYDCCNLKGEIAARSKKSARTASSMADFLDRLLSNRSPLVFGYSGWESDVFMTALKRRLKRGLPYNIYWFCYQRSAIQSLPDEVKRHANVFFVVPEASAAPPDRKAGPEQKAAERTLPASQALDALIREFAIEAPPLTRDPLGFFARQLRRSLPPEDEGRTTPDPYLISKVIRRVERRSLSATEEKLERIRDALRRSQYREAVDGAAKITNEELDRDDKEELMQALYLAGSKLLDRSAEERQAYTRVVELGNELLAESPDDAGIRECVAKAMVNAANTLEGADTVPAALKLYAAVVDRFGDAGEPELQYQVARAMYNIGVTYGEQKRHSEAAAAYDAMARRFEGHTHSGIRDLTAWALYHQALALIAAGKGDAAEQLLRSVAARFGAGESADCQEAVILAHTSLGDQRVLKAKQALAAGDEAAAQAHLAAAQDLLAEAARRNPDHPYVLGSQAYVEYLLGARDRARQLLTRAVSLGGAEFCGDEREFVQQNPLPQDEEFIALLDSLSGAPA